jgi:hypothetical protein
VLPLGQLTASRTARPATIGTHQIQTACDGPWAAAVSAPARMPAVNSRGQLSVAAVISATAIGGHG